MERVETEAGDQEPVEEPAPVAAAVAVVTARQGGVYILLPPRLLWERIQSPPQAGPEETEVPVV